MEKNVLKISSIALALFVITPVENGVEYADENGGIEIKFYGQSIVKATKWIPEGKKIKKALW